MRLTFFVQNALKRLKEWHKLIKCLKNLNRHIFLRPSNKKLQNLEKTGQIWGENAFWYCWNIICPAKTVKNVFFVFFLFFILGPQE